MSQPPTGLLYSQIGYDLGGPVRAIVRGPKDLLAATTQFRIIAMNGATELEAPVQYWGELWGSHWWICDFSEIDHGGRYILTIRDEGVEWMRSEPLLIGRGILWSTWFVVGVDQCERRARLTMNKVGWQDSGTTQLDISSHASMVIGLEDVLEHAGKRVAPDERERLELQIMNGCDYLASFQDQAQKLGCPPGSLSHQTLSGGNAIAPADTNQAVVCLARAAQLLSSAHAARKADYLRRAEMLMQSLVSVAPLGVQNFSRIAHGAPVDFIVPEREPMTRDVLMNTWAALELARAGLGHYKDLAINHANEVMRRQVARDRSEGGFHGHFYTFASSDLTEKAWVHHTDGNAFTSDAGGTFPNYVLPLLWMRRLWPDHADAPRWEQTVRDFAYGYLLPACRANPFGIVPLGCFKDRGLLWFAGLWHGMNAAYALTAAMCYEFERFFNDPAFREVAVGNMQWIAGLNAGLTRASLSASHLFSADVPDEAAVPVSMINGIGRRTAGNWLNLRGAICNGFSTGDQFQFDVPPAKENDGPHTFTDKDWITHAGGWLSALARMS